MDCTIADAAISSLFSHVTRRSDVKLRCNLIELWCQFEGKNALDLIKDDVALRNWMNGHAGRSACLQCRVMTKEDLVELEASQGLDDADKAVSSLRR